MSNSFVAEDADVEELTFGGLQREKKKNENHMKNDEMVSLKVGDMGLSMTQTIRTKFTQSPRACMVKKNSQLTI